MFKWVKFGMASVTGILVIAGVIIGIALTIIFNLYVEKQKEMKASTTSVVDDDEQPVEIVEDLLVEDEPNHKEEVPYMKSGVLTEENYAQLKPGITYEEAVKILGGNGRLNSEIKSAGYHSLKYKFEEEDEWRGIQITLTFINGELDSKTLNGGSEGKSEVTITAEQFDQVKTGMTYEEVKNIVGGEGVLRSEYGFADGDYHSQRYRYDGEARHSSGDFSFDDDKLTSKSQSGLK